jgi:hypothetical protein
LNRVARFSTACVALGLLALSGTAGAQVRTAVSPALPDTVDPLARAMGAEDRGDMKGATVAYQQVLQRALANAVSDGDRIDMALLGLERAWAELGVRDSILPILQRVVLLRRTDPVARGIQLRALIATNQDDAARLAFTDWRRSAPNEAAPYREYARNLLGAGRAQAADTVLADAARFLGSSRDISGEVAQLNVALERWIPAAVRYATAVIEQPWMQTAALFALQRVPVALRDSVRTTFAAAPVVLGPRRLLSNLELGWSEPRKAWVALAALAVDDSTIAAWREFGERAEFAESWLVARDAWAAVLEKRGDLDAARHAALAALHGGDPTGAIDIVSRSAVGKPGAAVAKALLAVHVEALGELGRADEAQKLVDASVQYIDERTRGALLKPLVDAWLRTGNLERARAAAKSADLLDDDETAGWLALYEGDLVGARKRLVRLDARRGAQIEALALLARTRTASSPALGAAFLAVARHDTTGAVTRFVALADSMPDAASALLATAARLEDSRGGIAANPHALNLWKRVRADYPKSPEAPEAALAWATSLARSGDTRGAVTQLEQMLLDYSDSAMAPQARRELERLRALVPPAVVASAA